MATEPETVSTAEVRVRPERGSLSLSLCEIGRAPKRRARDPNHVARGKHGPP